MKHFLHHWSVHIVSNIKITSWIRKQIKFEFHVIVCSLIQMVTCILINLHFTLFNNWGSWLKYIPFSSSPLVNSGLFAATVLIICSQFKFFPEEQSLLIYCYSLFCYSFVIMFCLIDFTLDVFLFGLSDLGHWNFNIFTLSECSFVQLQGSSPLVRWGYKLGLATALLLYPFYR